MEYLLIPGSGTQMSDGLGNACHFLKAHRHTQSTLLMECAKAQSQKLTELSGHFRLTHLQDGSFLRFPRWQRHNIRFCTLKEKKKKRCDLAFYYCCQAEENREVSNGLKCKFISWPICLTKDQGSPEDPQNLHRSALFAFQFPPSSRSYPILQPFPLLHASLARVPNRNHLAASV